MDFDLIRRDIGALMDEKRFTHVLGCESEAVELARRWGADVDDARLAALLHDMTKQLDRNQQLKLCAKYGIVLDDIEKYEYKLIHALTGAEVAADKYGASPAVCGAIRWHTTGRAGMSLLEKILYVADYIEPGRDFDGVSGLRELAYYDLDGAVLLGLEMSIAEVLSSGRLMHICTIEARNSLLGALKYPEKMDDRFPG